MVRLSHGRRHRWRRRGSTCCWARWRVHTTGRHVRVADLWIRSIWIGCGSRWRCTSIDVRHRPWCGCARWPVRVGRWRGHRGRWRSGRCGRRLLRLRCRAKGIERVGQRWGSRGLVAWGCGWLQRRHDRSSSRLTCRSSSSSSCSSGCLYRALGLPSSCQETFADMLRVVVLCRLVIRRHLIHIAQSQCAQPLRSEKLSVLQVTVVKTSQLVGPCTRSGNCLRAGGVLEIRVDVAGGCLEDSHLLDE